MNVRDARVEEAVETFYQPENFELQLIRTNDSSLDRGIHRRCVATCCQDTDTFHNWTAKVFTSERGCASDQREVSSGLIALSVAQRGSAVSLMAGPNCC